MSLYNYERVNYCLTGAHTCSVTLRALLRLVALLVLRVYLNTARLLGILIVDTYCAVLTNLLYCLKDAVLDGATWECVPFCSTDACSVRWTMQDFIPGLRTFWILILCSTKSLKVQHVCVCVWPYTYNGPEVTLFWRGRFCA